MESTVGPYWRRGQTTGFTFYALLRTWKIRQHYHKQIWLSGVVNAFACSSKFSIRKLRFCDGYIFKCYFFMPNINGYIIKYFDFLMFDYNIYIRWRNDISTMVLPLMSSVILSLVWWATQACAEAWTRSLQLSVAFDHRQIIATNCVNESSWRILHCISLNNNQLY